MAGAFNPVASWPARRIQQQPRVLLVVVVAALTAAAWALPSPLLLVLLVVSTAVMADQAVQLQVRRYRHPALAPGDQPESSPAAVPTPRPLPPLCRLLKRVVDVIAASLALVAALPVLVAAAVAIVIDSHGGVFFTQTRVGAGGRPFRIVKLRTMRVGSDEAEHRSYVAALIAGQGEPHHGMYKLVHDARKTRVGRLLRSYSIDELPQLWNVLRGDMSLVGPRPPLPEEVAAYDESARARLVAPPGLTGLWQVSGRSRLSFEEMVELDVRYWQEWSPLLDLRILMRTPKAVIWNRETA